MLRQSGLIRGYLCVKVADLKEEVMSHNEEVLQTLLDLSGKTEALRLAFVSLFASLPNAQKTAFLSTYKKQIESWGEVSLATTNPDIWMRTVEIHANRLTTLLEKLNQSPDS